jgi:hypothetical protein
LSDEAGNAEERAAHEAKARPAPIDEGTPTVHGPPLEQAQGEQARKEARREDGEEATEDMPTLPPASRGSVVGLRWATFPLKRPSGQGRPYQISPDQIGPNQIGPSHIGAQPYEPGPPTAVLPMVLSAPQLRPERGATSEQDTAEGPAVGGSGDPDVQAQRPRRRGRALLLLIVLTLVALVAVGALVLDGGSPHRTAGRVLTPQTAFEGFLAESAQAHQLVSAAVSDACRPAPPSTPTRQGLIVEVGRAVELRRSVLAGIASDRQQLLKMNGGPSLIGDLDDASDASLSADQGYEAWLEDLQATGCYGAPTNDVHYRAATEASLAASVAKERVVGIWAGVASRYGLRSWTAGQL